ncbi:MAG: energy-coupling factor transport system permease protein [Microbacteriaceae bacterium]|jgi:energy-coupling factor transport system substrate-specific component|nr:energy-coupling factor transport system permease protein [Microbacteriaceae bacterium]
MTIAPPSRRSWRVVDIVVAAVLAAACGLVFTAWAAISSGPYGLLGALAPGAEGLANGPFLFAGVLGGLVIRKPGAAVFTELVAAVLEALAGSQWGLSVLLSGLVQGLGAEIVFAVLLYRSFGPITALLAGAGAGLGEDVVDILTYYVGKRPEFMITYGITTVVSGAVVGLLSWLLVRALAATGALDRFAAGSSARRAV